MTGNRVRVFVDLEFRLGIGVSTWDITDQHCGMERLPNVPSSTACILAVNYPYRRSQFHTVFFFFFFGCHFVI
jgi:hypothetical protein